MDLVSLTVTGVPCSHGIATPKCDTSVRTIKVRAPSTSELLTYSGPRRLADCQTHLLFVIFSEAFFYSFHCAAKIRSDRPEALGSKYHDDDRKYDQQYLPVKHLTISKSR